MIIGTEAPVAVATLDDSVSASPDVQVWHAGDGYAMTVPMRQSQKHPDAKFSADGRYLLIVGSHSSWLWDLEPGALRVLPESAGWTSLGRRVQPVVRREATVRCASGTSMLSAT